MRLKIAFLLGFIFFVVGLVTLKDYGINWDTINHLPRGQAYLQYFLTGRKDYANLLPWKSYWQDPDRLGVSSGAGSRSYYQNDNLDFSWMMENDGHGHPPLSDILSSVFNRVLFGKLRLINDIDSYRVYGIFLAAALVGLIFYWVSGLYGKTAGFFASLSLALYPLFWAESHFNTEKDIPEAVYWSFLVYFVWKGFTEKKRWYLLLSGLFFGLALGTKFNILFVGFVLGPWLLSYLKFTIFRRENLKLILIGAIAILTGVVILYATWPYMWQDIISGTSQFISFYKEIGINMDRDPRFVGLFGLVNTYPLLWILYTTPLPVVFFSIVGFVTLIFGFRKDKYLTGLLFILWLLIPIGRVSVPKANIYGGVRQIMEYIPALSIMAGIGVGVLTKYFSKWVNRKYLIPVFLVPFVFVTVALYKIHPNENVFFNRLVGGLSGAKAQKLPSWGNSFGEAYRKGISWINKNAPQGSSLVFAFELMPNIPPFWVRPDIVFSNTQRSGFLKQGEYAMTLVYDGTKNRSYYDVYLENEIFPVFQTKVDNVPIFNIWQNDIAHTLAAYRGEELVSVGWKVTDGIITADFKTPLSLSHFDLIYSENASCEIIQSGSVAISSDGKTWQEQPEVLPSGVISILRDQASGGRLQYPFLGEPARYLKINFSPDNACIKNVRGLTIYRFPN